MSKPIDVLFTQRILKVSGFDPKGLDGRWGKNTQAASDAFDAKYEEIANGLGRFDPRTESNIHTLVPKAQIAARTFMVAARHMPFTVKILSGTRTYAEQAQIYAQGRTSPGNIVTNAPPGSSNHNFGIAFDVGIFAGGEYYDGSDRDPARAHAEEQAYIDLAAVEKAAIPGLEWGGDWKSSKDRPHYQLSTGKSVSEVARLLERGEAYV